jgi:hypothetical protein
MTKDSCLTSVSTGVTGEIGSPPSDFNFFDSRFVSSAGIYTICSVNKTLIILRQFSCVAREKTY